MHTVYKLIKFMIVIPGWPYGSATDWIPRHCTGQNARAVATCTECRKPRVVYSRTALSESHRVTLAILLSEFDYTCGAPLTPPDSSLYSRVMTKANLQCGVGVEMSYYSTTANIRRKDICSHCGIEDG